MRWMTPSHSHDRVLEPKEEHQWYAQPSPVPQHSQDTRVRKCNLLLETPSHSLQQDDVATPVVRITVASPRTQSEHTDRNMVRDSMVRAASSWRQEG